MITMMTIVILVVLVTIAALKKPKNDSVDKAPKPPKLTLGRCALIFLLGIVIAFLGVSMLQQGNDLGLLVGIAGVACMFLAFPLAVSSLKARGRYLLAQNQWKEKLEQEAAQEAYRQANPHWKQEEFYQKAKAAGIEHVDSESNIARLVLFAQNNDLGIDKQQLVADYRLGQQAAQLREKKAMLEQQEAEEQRLEEKNTRYALPTYLEKATRYCDDIISENRIISRTAMYQRDAVLKQASALSAASQQREHSWAIHGGIASAIGGTAAGVSAAYDIQRKNEAIRQQNAEVTRFYAGAAVMGTHGYLTQAVDADEKVEKWTAEREKCRSMLTQSMDQQFLLEQLVPQADSQVVSETGAVGIRVKLQPKAGLLIYGDTPALVDGSIKVCLWDGDQPAGYAVCALPFNGVQFPTTLHCVCRKPSRKAQKYKLTFEPYTLWAVEKR